mmetsp:Transcript_29469/g.68501  ORF Transcript_29469/g.68501 Transcript_29469/m.68501 type:complete len:103 (+) Transcript_29469:72-380(+)
MELRMEQNEGRLAHIGTKSFAGAADSGEPQSVVPRNAPVEFERDDSEPRRQARNAGGREGRGRGRGRSRSRRRTRSRSRRRGGNKEEDFALDGLLEEARRKK